MSDDKTIKVSENTLTICCDGGNSLNTKVFIGDKCIGCLQEFSFDANVKEYLVKIKFVFPDDESMKLISSYMLGNIKDNVELIKKLLPMAEIIGGKDE